MTNFREVSDETKALFNKALDNTSIPSWVEFRLVANDDLKKRPVQIEKQNVKVEYITDGVQAIVFINEEILDGLVEEDIQIKVIDEELTRLQVDLENGTIKLEPFDFTTNSGFLEKHGADEVLLLKMSIESLYEQKKQKEDEKKAQTKLDKKKK